MADKTIVLSRFEKIAFAYPATRRDVTLYVERVDGGKLRIRGKRGTIAAIAGDGMAAKIVPEVRSSKRETYPLVETEAGQTYQLTTPEAHGSTCVYLDCADGAYRLIGGASIIDAIEGDGLEQVLERD